MKGGITYVFKMYEIKTEIQIMCDTYYEMKRKAVICLPISSWSPYPCCYPDNHPTQYEYARIMEIKLNVNIRWRIQRQNELSCVTKRWTCIIYT